MAYAYEEALGHYLHRPALRYIKTTDPKKNRAFVYFQKAAVIADRLDMDYEDYIQAQFYWFDQWFRRHPKVYELASLRSKFPAIDRAIAYQRLIRDEDHPRRKVQSLSRRVIASDDQLDKINTERLNRLISSWQLTEEEVLLRFSAADVGYFDVQWLRKHPVYQRLQKQHKL
jgi:hypothetical protein